MQTATLTANRNHYLPDATGTAITTGNLSSITATGTITSERLERLHRGHCLRWHWQQQPYTTNGVNFTTAPRLPVPPPVPPASVW